MLRVMEWERMEIDEEKKKLSAIFALEFQPEKKRRVKNKWKKSYLSGV